MGILNPVASSRKVNSRRGLRDAQAARLQERANVAGSFDSAQTTNLNQNHWARADNMSANQAASPMVRQTQRNRAIYECANNAYGKGILLTDAFGMIGTGPRLQIPIEDNLVASEIEGKFRQWCRKIKFAQKLRTLWMTRRREGEGFGQIFQNGGTDYPVKMDIGLVDPARVADNTMGAIQDKNNVDGIIFDEWGNPTTYMVLREHPGSMTTTANKADEIDAKFMLHTYLWDRAEQDRGLSEFGPSLPLFAMMRRMTLATLHASETAAELGAVILETEGLPDEEDQPDDMSTAELRMNMMTVAPSGYKANQMKPEHPATTYPMFKREIISEAARPLSQPYNVAAADSSNHNYSSGRMDKQGTTIAKRVLLDEVEGDIVDPVFEMWALEAVLVSGYLSLGARAVLRPDMPHTFHWDGDEHVDPKKERDAQTKGLEFMTVTLPEVYAKRGQDYRTALVTQAKAMNVTPEVLQAALFAKYYGGASRPDDGGASESADRAEEAAEEAQAAAEGIRRMGL